LAILNKLDQLGFIIDHELSVDLVLQSKQRSLLGASIITRVFVIIVARKNTIIEIVKIILQP
jgi:hypothetical protein